MPNDSRKAGLKSFRGLAETGSVVDRVDVFAGVAGAFWAEASLREHAAFDGATLALDRRDVGRSIGLEGAFADPDPWRGGLDRRFGLGNRSADSCFSRTIHAKARFKSLHRRAGYASIFGKLILGESGRDPGLSTFGI